MPLPAAFNYYNLRFHPGTGHIDPLPSYVWYQDMVDFAEGINDEAAGRRLARVIQGKEAVAGAVRWVRHRPPAGDSRE